jgi:hypothetical protein
VAARSAYYRLKPIHGIGLASLRAEANYELTPVQIQPWSDEQVLSLLRSYKAAEALGFDNAEAALVYFKGQLGERADLFLRQPFFATSLMDITGAVIAQGLRDDDDDDEPAQTKIARLLQFLLSSGIHVIIDFMIAREVGKLVDDTGRPILSAAQHVAYLEEIAEEMWWQETMTITPQTAEAVAEMLTETIQLSQKSRSVLRERAVVHALLREDKRNGMLCFSHEYFYSHFVARRIWSAVTENSRVREFLTRATVSPLIANDFGRCATQIPSPLHSAPASSVSEEHEKKVLAALETLANQRIPTSFKDLARRNVGTLVWGMSQHAFRILRERPIGMRSMTFENLEFTGEARGLVFYDCDINFSDFSKLAGTNIAFEACRFVLPRFSRGQRFDESWLGEKCVIQGIELDGRRLFDPEEISHVLSDLGLALTRFGPPIALSAARKRYLGLIERFVRRVERGYRFSEEDLRMAGLSQTEGWSEVWNALARCGLLETSRVARKGTLSMHRLLVQGEALLNGVANRSEDSRVERFWSQLDA